MSRRIGVVAAACTIALVACANGGDPSNDYQLPEGDDGGLGGDASGESGASSSGSSGGSSNGGDDAGGAADSGDGGGGGGGGGDGGTPASCSSPDTCTASATALTSIAGDQSGPTDNATGTTSEWLRIDLTEQDSSFVGHPMKLTAVLTSPAGLNFDLYAYLGSKVGDIQCTTPKAQSTNAAGQTDTVSFEWGETGTLANGKDDSATVMLEIRWVSGACSSAATWSLAAHGN